MKTLAMLLLALVFALAACGDDDEDTSSPAPAAETATQKDDAAIKKAEAKRAEEAAMKEKDAAKARKGTRITLGDSEFGSMLFDSKKQAIYIFEKDAKNKSVCYDECAEAWPPVFTKGEPRTGKGVDASLLGTIERRDGKSQVTYDGKPLYFYAHEEPGEVRCHNVNLNGGLWWVVGADGKRRP